MRERGVTLLEVAVTAALFVVLVGGVGAALASDNRTARVLVGHLGPEFGAQRALARVASDLELASVQGEDLNGNGVLDGGEDTNENGVLDADWNLADGTATQTSLRFNMRTDEYDQYGYRTATGVYSGRVTYEVVGGRLVRERDRDGGGTTRVVIADRISGMRFSREGRVVTVSLDVRFPSGVYATNVRTISTSVRLLN